jgi:predicted PurR-regulated permease PerM/N-acetylglutamate synthase-like GNAT family acetyltransferase
MGVGAVDDPCAKIGLNPNQEKPMARESNKPIRRWSSFTKRAVVLSILMLLALTLYRFRNILPPLMIAFLLAFILNPAVGFLTSRTHISRGLATGIVFLVLIALALGAAIAAPVTAVPSIQDAVRASVEFVKVDLTRLISDIGDFIEQPIEIGGYSLDLINDVLVKVYQELSALLKSFVASVAEGTIGIARNVASGAFWLIVILMATFYLVKDADQFIGQLENLTPPGYHDDVVRLRRQITDVWNAFLRGQLVVGLVMFTLTTVICLSIGLPYAVVMGVIAGVMEFIPNVGPIIALVPAVAVALFEGSSFLALNNFWFAVLVLGLYIVIQQIEGNVIVPRVMGSTLHLHPLVILIGIIIGGSITGILGMLLAAPVLATLRVIGNYTFCRLYDRDPFAEPEAKPPKPGLIVRACKATWGQLQDKVEKRKEQMALRRQIQIRSAQATDRPAVEAICAKIWEGDDYVPKVWDDWLADPYGELVVAELEGRVVGIAKLSRLADDEWWLEGLRVDPAYRRRGVAAQLQTYLVEKACQVGQGTLRFGTHSDNEPVHRIAARDGFCRLATYQHYRADPLPDADVPPLRQLTEADLPAAWAWINDTPRHEASGGLYEDLWTWKNLTQKRLAHHLAAGDVWGADHHGELAALALIGRIEEEQVNVGHVDGQEETLTTILQGLRRLATQLGCAEVRFKPVAEPALLAAVEAAGYERHRDNSLWIFELQLQPTGG